MCCWCSGHQLASWRHAGADGAPAGGSSDSSATLPAAVRRSRPRPREMSMSSWMLGTSPAGDACGPVARGTREECNTSNMPAQQVQRRERAALGMHDFSMTAQ